MLKAFLVDCRKVSRERGHPQLVNISLPVRHIEPLAVLHSIFEPGERHFYLERPNAEEALAGAEAVVEARFGGPDRFRKAQQFGKKILENTIAYGRLDGPFTGPQFLCGFTFSEVEPKGSVFESGAVFIPRWQVSRKAGHYAAVANLMVDSSSDLDLLADKVWGAHEKFSAFDYDHFAAEPPGGRQLLRMEEAGGAEGFERSVRRALTDIQSGRYQKVVLARALDLEMNQPYEPLVYLNRLREQFSGCYAFSFANGRGQSFIGVTPERLVRLRSGGMRTMALAGTVSRGATAAEDARLGRRLLESRKDLHEHEVVIEAIRRRLGQHGLEAKAEGPPRLMRLSNVQHLLTPIEAATGERHILELLDCLHPTPAVGGSPREVTTSIIDELEPFDRGLYAGALGYFNRYGEGEFVVAIRSALIDGQRARLYAGSGIVEGSDPGMEKEETDLKLRAMLPSLSS